MKPEDFTSKTWRRLEELLKARLAELREFIDRPADLEKTSETRGSISEIKRILALAEKVSAREGVIPGELTGDGDDELYGIHE